MNKKTNIFLQVFDSISDISRLLVESVQEDK